MLFVIALLERSRQVFVILIYHQGRIDNKILGVKGLSMISTALPRPDDLKPNLNESSTAEASLISGTSNT